MSLFNFRPCKRLLLPCLLIGWHIQVLADNPVETQSIESQTTAEQAEIRTSGQEEQGWVEKKINPSTEWVENLFYPAIRWLERTVQGQNEGQKLNAKEPIVINGGPIPDGALPAHQAISLLTSIHSGRVLQITYEQPNRYRIKHLSQTGRVQTFYMHSQTGVIQEPETISSDEKPDLGDSL